MRQRQKLKISRSLARRGVEASQTKRETFKELKALPDSAFTSITARRISTGRKPAPHRASQREC